MKITTRLIGGKYGKFVEVKVEIQNAVFDLGFLDKKELQELSAKLLDVSLEMQEISETLNA